MSDETHTILAIVAITILALGCLIEGLNHQIIMMALVAIAGLGGYEVYKKRKGGEE